MGFWRKLFSPPGYIGAIVLAILGLTPADFARWVSDKVSPEGLSWISSDKARWAFVLGSILLFAGTYYRNRGQRSPDWDITINDALNYIENDSRETFPPPRTMTIRGVSVPASGTQHQAALVRLNQRLTFGELDISGHREIVPQPAPRLYEEVRRKIDVEYWTIAQLHLLNCFHCTTQLPQTYILSGDNHPNYYNLRMNRNQLRRVWPQKALLRRLWERWVLRKPRIYYYQGFG
jgi:hypothetical protein